jgi:hypothetical protein
MKTLTVILVAVALVAAVAGCGGSLQTPHERRVVAETCLYGSGGVAQRSNAAGRAFYREYCE